MLRCFNCKHIMQSHTHTHTHTHIHTHNMKAKAYAYTIYRPYQNQSSTPSLSSQLKHSSTKVFSSGEEEEKEKIPTISQMKKCQSPNSQSYLIIQHKNSSLNFFLSCACMRACVSVTIQVSNTAHNGCDPLKLHSNHWIFQETRLHVKANPLTIKV